MKNIVTTIQKQKKMLVKWYFVLDMLLKRVEPQSIVMFSPTRVE
jgi:hypothetical protein